MTNRVRTTLAWTVGAFVFGAAAVWVFKPGGSGLVRTDGLHGFEPRSGFVFLEADRRKSRAYLNFMYGLLYQERGQRDEAAERFAEACALDRVLQPSFESDPNPS